MRTDKRTQNFFLMLRYTLDSTNKTPHATVTILLGRYQQMIYNNMNTEDSTYFKSWIWAGDIQKVSPHKFPKLSWVQLYLNVVERRFPNSPISWVGAEHKISRFTLSVVLLHNCTKSPPSLLSREGTLITYKYFHSAEKGSCPSSCYFSVMSISL